jgi:hypothetical protein
VNGFTGSTDKIEMKSKEKIKKRAGKALFLGCLVKEIAINNEKGGAILPGQFQNLQQNKG